MSRKLYVYMQQEELLDFVRFLKQHDIYLSFMYNLHHQKGKSIRLLNFSPNLIDCSFIWWRTNQGDDFWQKFDELWRTEHLKKWLKK